jgi:subtilisin family serine protease
MTYALEILLAILISLQDLEGRATFLRNFAGTSSGDPQGHGTHVAGTIAGKTYGVAKKARVFGVTVLNSAGSGTT